MNKKITKLCIVLSLFVTHNVIANDFKSEIENYEHYTSKTQILQMDIDLKTLNLAKQVLETKIQKSKIECQGFGGCQAKTLYTPLLNSSKNTNKDRDLEQVINKPLPTITGIGQKTVNFDNGMRVYRVGELVYGVWLITEITSTSVTLKSKDDNSLQTIYFYWNK